MRLTVRLLGPLVLLLGHVTAAPAQTFTVFDAPNALLMVSSSINAQGDVTGYFNDGRGGGGFVRDAAGNITVFNAPGIALAFLSVTSINAGGEVTGSFIPFSNPFRQTGFVRDASGNFTRFDAPNADEPIQFGTQSLSIKRRRCRHGILPRRKPV